MSTHPTRACRRSSYDVRPWHRDYFPVTEAGRFLRAQVGLLVQPGTQLLDVGCGEQPLRDEVEDRGGRYLGIDLDGNAGRRDQVVGSVLALPLRTGRFDVVLCSEVLEHVADTRSALREIARVTRAGGRVVLTLPFVYPLHEEPYDFVRLTPHMIADCARDVGLAVEEVGGRGDELAAAATLLDHAWIRSLPPHAGVLRRGAGVAWRVALNLGALSGARLLGRWLPKKAFPTLVAVLRRVAEMPAEVPPGG